MAATVDAAALVAQANARGPTSGFTDVPDDDVQLPAGFDRASAKIFKPIQVGAFALSHRIIHAALGRSRSMNGSESPLAAIYFTQRASPGSLIISQATGVDSVAKSWPYAVELDSEEHINALTNTIRAVHAKGAYWFQQLSHVGRCSSPSLVKHARQRAGLLDAPYYGYKTVSASEIGESGINTHSGELFGNPHALTATEIHDIVAKFKRTAENAVKAGADGIELLSGNGFLIDQFLHDNINVRTDQYGGSVENRARFLLEIVDAVADVVGYQKIGLRLSPFSNFHETDGSHPLDQILYVAQQVATRGVAYIQVGEARVSRNLGMEENLQRLLAKGIAPEDISLRPFRKLLKETRPSNPSFTPTQLFGAGGYTAATAILTLEEDRADAVVFGRRYISNPDLIERIRRGWPLTPYDRSTFYTHGPQGYITYKNYENPVQVPNGHSSNGITNGHTNGIKTNGQDEKPKKKVAIIGAGVSGIVTASAFQRLGGFELHIFERKAVPGGSWAFDPVSSNDLQFLTPDLEIINAPLPRPIGDLPVTVARTKQNRFHSSPMYKNLFANIPFNVMSEDSSIELPTPGPGESPFLTGTQISEAVSRAASSYESLIRYTTTLENVEKLPGDRLKLLLRRENQDGTDTWYEEEFDHLVVATGHNSVPKMPKFQGIESWTGGLRHTTNWRSGEEFRDQKILIIGTSESAIDITLQSLPFVKKPIYVSQRTVHPRYPTVFERDGVTVVTTISHFDSNKIHLTDSTVLSDIDVVVFATGYAYTYPFFPPDVRPPAVAGLRVPGLYQHIFDTHNQNTIAFIGVANATLSWLTWEKSAFLVALLWSGRIELPPLDEQRKWEAKRLAETGDRMFHIMAQPSERVLYFDDLNVLAWKYLQDPTSLDDELLRSFPYEWMVSLMQGREDKEKFYGITNTSVVPRDSMGKTQAIAK